MLRNNADVRRCSYSELGLPVFVHTTKRENKSAMFNILMVISFGFLWFMFRTSSSSAEPNFKSL